MASRAVPLAEWISDFGLLDSQVEGIGPDRDRAGKASPKGNADLPEPGQIRLDRAKRALPESNRLWRSSRMNAKSCSRVIVDTPRSLASHRAGLATPERAPSDELISSSSVRRRSVIRRSLRLVPRTSGGSGASVSQHVTRFRVRAALSLPCTPRIRRRMSRASSVPLHRYEVRREFQTPPSTTALQPSSEPRALGRLSRGRAPRTLDDGHGGRPRVMSRWFSRSSRVTDQYEPKSECDLWNHQRPPARNTTPAPNGQRRSEYSANEKTGDTTQIKGTRTPSTRESAGRLRADLCNSARP